MFNYKRPFSSPPDTLSTNTTEGFSYVVDQYASSVHLQASTIAATTTSPTSQPYTEASTFSYNDSFATATISQDNSPYQRQHRVLNASSHIQSPSFTSSRSDSGTSEYTDISRNCYTPVTYTQHSLPSFQNTFSQSNIPQRPHSANPTTRPPPLTPANEFTEQHSPNNGKQYFDYAKGSNYVNSFEKHGATHIVAPESTITYRSPQMWAREAYRENDVESTASSGFRTLTSNSSGTANTTNTDESDYSSTGSAKQIKLGNASCKPFHGLITNAQITSELSKLRRYVKDFEIFLDEISRDTQFAVADIEWLFDEERVFKFLGKTRKDTRKDDILIASKQVESSLLWFWTSQVLRMSNSETDIVKARGKALNAVNEKLCLVDKISNIPIPEISSNRNSSFSANIDHVDDDEKDVSRKPIRRSSRITTFSRGKKVTANKTRPVLNGKQIYRNLNRDGILTKLASLIDAQLSRKLPYVIPDYQRTTGKKIQQWIASRRRKKEQLAKQTPLDAVQ